MNSFRGWILLIILCFSATAFASQDMQQDLPQIKQKGVLRHLGVPYANFVRLEGGELSGMSVEIIRLFAKHIGVEYQFVQSDWDDIIQALIGKDFVVLSGNKIQYRENPTEIKGDLICTGFTVLPWREKMVAYSDPTFPTQVWAIAKKGNFDKVSADFASQSEFKAWLSNFSILGKADTCLDPKLYGLDARARYFSGSVNDIALAVLKGEADYGILDCPDTLVALRKWPKEIKVIGTISEVQSMGVGFRQNSTALRDEFNLFMKKLKDNGTYYRIVKKYYPDIFFYFPETFKEINKTGRG
jgi:ABC-type amino acid transport substrate-binding protein